jgi:hypothetical protein
MNSLGTSVAVGALVVLSGCCALAPCHPAITVAGRVVAASGEPVVGAAVKAHSKSGVADAKGCFLLYGADALPFEFLVEASGFKPLRVDMKAGSYQAQVVMAPLNTSQGSSLQLSKSRSFPATPVPECA